MTAMPPPPKATLRAGTIYSADNGRLICLHCAGASAKFTGRDLSGMKVVPMTQNDNAEWLNLFGEAMTCEGKCTSYQDPRNN